MLFAPPLGLSQCFENNLFKDAKNLYSQVGCDLSFHPENKMKIGKSLLTLESGL